ncbi:hypothetical protein D3C73_1286900 [compost metagenome]
MYDCVNGIPGGVLLHLFLEALLDFFAVPVGHNQDDLRIGLQNPFRIERSVLRIALQRRIIRSNIDSARQLQQIAAQGIGQCCHIRSRSAIDQQHARLLSGSGCRSCRLLNSRLDLCA